MATSILTDVVKDPGGNVVGTSPGTQVNFRLMANGSPTPGFRISDNVNVASLIVTSASTAGAISQALENNTNITPSGTYYVAEILCPTSQGGTQEWALLSSSSASPQTFKQALAAALPAFTPITVVPPSILGGNNIFTGINQFNGNVYFKSGVPWFDVQAFGAVGDGITDDTAAIVAARTAANAAGGGIVYLSKPTATYYCAGSLGTWPDLVGLAGAGNGLKGSNATNYVGVSTLVTDYNGAFITTAANYTGPGFADFTVRGTAGKTSQDLFTLPVYFLSTMRNVHIVNAGHYGITGSPQEAHFDHVWVTASNGDTGFYLTGAGSNANEFTKCRFDANAGWGIFIDSAVTDETFDNCVFEGNAQTVTATGGMGVNASNVVLIGCHFEDNETFSTSRNLTYTGGGVFNEVGTTYLGTRSLSFSGGVVIVSSGIFTNISTHAVIGAGAPTIWIVPNQSGGGAFTLTDNSTGVTQVIDPVSSRFSLGASYVELAEIADPLAPSTDKGRLYVRDSAGNKSQLVVLFPSGASQIIATEP